VNGTSPLISARVYWVVLAVVLLVALSLLALGASVLVSSDFEDRLGDSLFLLVLPIGAGWFVFHSHYKRQRAHQKDVTPS